MGLKQSTIFIIRMLCEILHFLIVIEFHITKTAMTNTSTKNLIRDAEIFIQRGEDT